MTIEEPDDGDDRLRSDAAGPAGRSEKSTRRTKSSDPGREPREMTDRAIADDREITDEERMELFAQEHYQSVLPDLPKTLPGGFHTIWLSTANTSDSIARRTRLGYIPIRPEEIPGWLGNLRITTGAYEGFVGINEMLAYKISDKLWRFYMEEGHHNRPRQAEEGITALVDEMRTKARSKGGDVIEEDGMAALRASAPKPRFDG